MVFGNSQLVLVGKMFLKSPFKTNVLKKNFRLSALLVGILNFGETNCLHCLTTEIYKKNILTFLNHCRWCHNIIYEKKKKLIKKETTKSFFKNTYISSNTLFVQFLQAKY